ncbi:aminoglycoside phosphotransferase family protein [Nocardioides panacis]|uniref:Aminoglycoside phosphotransferase family protein n=1 Tax=Nocardioides panacis TaxID=2849501 RepID=A0A975T021_9ACTN|nr:aminoglycoside phosphotransferase family protein [Nocardioides panacis]QWZ09130.1 aminoglycoside phosphotransferase family protein [Nocardioides panacis]
MLTDAARSWAEEVLGARVAHVAALSGGVASRMLLLTTVRGEEAVLRQLVEDPWRRHAEALLSRERDVQALLAGTGVPAPRTLALDATGERTGDPGLLMTRLPGAVDLRAAGPSRLTALAALLLAVHRVEPAPGSRPREYQSWAGEAKWHVPPWAEDPALYVEAFERLRSPAPSYAPVFLHRDFHPANVLWSGDRVSGLVDWVETSTGPADLDVAHCASHLAGLHGVQAARTFRRLYVDQGGVLAHDPDAAAYWQLLDLVAMLPDPLGREGGGTPETVERLWRDAGRPDLDVRTARSRREGLLRAVLGA